MLLFLSEDGVLSTISNNPALNQGSIKANEVNIMSKLDYATEGTVLLGFELPNGQTTTYATTYVGTAQGYNVWTYTMAAAVLQYPGTVRVQALLSKNGVTVATTTVPFTVNRGTASITTQTTERDWNTLLQIYQQCQANALKSEGYAIGEQNGQAVTEGEYYQNNSKYYKEVANEKALKAEGFAVGEQDGTPVGSTSPYYNNNAKSYKLVAEGYAVGKQNGTDVGEGETYYHDNAKYYNTKAGEEALKSEGWAEGKQNGVEQTEGAYYHHNAKYWEGLADQKASEASQKATDAGNSAQSAANSATNAYTSAGQASYYANQSVTNALKAEGWAIGKQNGEDVPEGSPYYNNNAKVYADTASQIYQAKQDAVPITGFPLIENDKLNRKYIPDDILGQVTFKGVWNAQTGTANPAWTSSDVKKGNYWICSGHGGSKTPNNVSGAISFALGDWAIITNESPLTWQKVENTDAVTSVNSRTGAVLTYHTLSAGSTYYTGDTIFNGTNLLLVVTNFTYTAGMDYSSYVKSYGMTQSQIEALINSTYLAGKFEGDDFIVVDENATDTKVAVTLDTDFKPWIVELTGTSGTLSADDYAKLCGVNSSYTAQVLLDDELYQPNAIGDTYDTYIGGTKVITIQKPSGAWSLTTYETVTSSEKTTWNGKSVVSASTSQVQGASEAKSINVNGTNYNLAGGLTVTILEDGDT